MTCASCPTRIEKRLNRLDGSRRRSTSPAPKLALGLALAFVAAFLVNRLLIGRGRGHAVVHAHR